MGFWQFCNSILTDVVGNTSCNLSQRVPYNKAETRNSALVNLHSGNLFPSANAKNKKQEKRYSLLYSCLDSQSLIEKA